MPRTARQRSSTGIYHAIQRGINRQTIFHDAEDQERYLTTIDRYLRECAFDLYGYCLMGNHVHLLIKESEQPLSVFMKKVGTSYVYWYNHKHDRIGHLFQGRFRSEVVESEGYLLTVLRYIHQNPVKAGLVNSVGDYKWSSYCNYFNESSIIKADFILDIFNSNRKMALKQYREFMNTENDDKCLELSTKIRLTDNKVKSIILEHINSTCINETKKISNEHKSRLYRYLKEIIGVPTRQIARATGESRWYIDQYLE